MDEDDQIYECKVRFDRLGFKPQKDILYNKLLPYANELDDKSVQVLSEIKAHLGKSVMMREMRPGCAMWASRLAKYISVYGMKFSKEDHLTFIHLMYELIIIPNLEPWLVSKFSHILIKLLKKKELLSPDELVLPWRPLYDLCDRVLNTSAGAIGMYRYFSLMGTALESLIHAAKFYFKETATQEILELCRPKLCPFDVTTISTTMEVLEWFLPLTLPPDLSHKGYELWLDELMGQWEACHNSPIWEGDLMWLMARLADSNIGRINWEPHLPLMFSRFLRSLNLPVHYKQTNPLRAHKMDTSAIALWIVCVLGGKSSAQQYLDKLMKALESYFHPANYGRYVIKLKELLRKLPLYFIQRLHNERYKKLTWETPVPDSHKLTEEDVTSFVESLKGVSIQAMFCKMGSKEVSQALQHLATLRPNIVIPPVLERMYTNLATLTEPHKLTAAMQCMVAVARPLVRGAKLGYPEGPTHVVPLLLATLPGIDPNDIRKCFVTFQFVSTLATMVPFVDCSGALEQRSDLTEEEKEICLATAEFEDFVLQFLDRCFTLIESSSLETTRLEWDLERRSKLENMSEGALASTVTSLMMQTSPYIFKSGLRKLHNFVVEHILEIQVAGHFLATMCRSFAKVNPEDTCRVLLPHLCETILTLTESSDILSEEILDNELLYNLLLLSELVDCRGNALLPHMNLILKVLDRTLHLKCREGYVLSIRTLRHLLSGLTTHVPLEYHSSPAAFKSSLKDYLPIRDWGEAGNLNNLNLEWFMPGEQEAECVQRIVSRYLPPELQRFDDFITDRQKLTREELQCSLSIVIGLLGCKTLLPSWDEPPLKLSDSCLPTIAFKPLPDLAVAPVRMPDGSNVRLTLANTMHQIQEKLLTCAEDDTKSFFSLVTIWECLLMDRSCSSSTLELHWKNMQVVKKLLEDRLVGKKQHLRALLINRVVLQHEMLTDCTTVCLTATHQRIMVDLLTLATSHYSEVRTVAQSKLFAIIGNFSFSYTVLMPLLVANLQQDSEQQHELFKGSLHMLLGPKRNPLVTRHDWEVLGSLWPTLVKSKPSDKLSVVRLLEALVEVVHKHFPTITIILEVPDQCVAIASRLWDQKPTPSLPPLTPAEVAQGKEELSKLGQCKKEQYCQLLDSLMDALEHGNLHWRYHTIALSFLRDLVHPEQIYPARVVACFLRTLIHDSIELRKIAIRGTVFLLKQQKHHHPKVTVPAPELHGLSGDRADNKWVQYSSSNRPTTAEQWDQPRYLHKAYSGYNAWPKQLEVYAPSGAQPRLDRSEADLSPEEREVDSFFSEPSNVDKLIGFLSLEEKKGKDKFHGYHFILFKGLFRNYGDKHLHLFLPHLTRLVSEKQESGQRCATEIIAGLIRGSKHWPFEKVVALWERLTPIIRTALSNMTVETVADWGICFATAAESRDPNRHHWLLELLMEDPLRDEASFIECGRLYCLQGALCQQEWRVSELLTRLYIYFRPFLTHPFQNVRERLGSVITNILELDLVVGGGKQPNSPRVADFISEVLPQLAVLNEASAENNGEDGVEEAADRLKVVCVNTEERDVAIRLLKTVCRCLIGSLGRAQYGAHPEYFRLLPLLCLFESYEADEELSKTCTTTLSGLAQALILPRHVPLVMQVVDKVSRSISWCARATCLEFLQVFVFHNMATLLSDPAWVNQVSEVVLRLLEDEWLDVRVKAGQVLGGLLHCHFLPTTRDLLDNFRTKSATKLKKNARCEPERIRVRHCGVLGLCAFINAHPYEVPEFVPEMFAILGQHFNDPQPIPSTIRKTLGDFKRTHHDNWEQHSLKFTELQLEVLGDLMVPPSYYA